ncbi:MAG: ribonuclease HII [Maribacter sp.]|nr:ribonuclease HII [Maribacter sp.]
MTSRFFIGLVLLLVLGCGKQQNQTNSLLEFAPQNAVVLIKINDLNGFKSSLKNNNFISKFESFNIYSSIIKGVGQLDRVNTQAPSLLAFSELGKENYEFTFVTTDSASTFVLDSTQNISKESISLADKKINKYKIEDDVLYEMVYGDKIVISSSQVILENLSKYFGSKSPETLERLYKIASSTKTASVFINLENSEPLFKSILKENIELRGSNFSDWISVDLNVSQNHFSLNGISVANDSLKNYVNLFKDTNPLLNSTPSFAPRNADAILSYTFDDYSVFARNRQQYLNFASEKDSLFNTIEEIGFIYQNNSKAVLLNTYGSERISEYIVGLKTSESEYQGNQILELGTTDFLNIYLAPIVSNFKANFCTIIENAFVFSPNKELLQEIINNYKSGSTFEKTDTYISAQEVLANESSILFVANSDRIERILNADFSKDLYNDFKRLGFGNSTFAVQVVADQEFYHTSLVIRQTARKSKINTVSSLYTVQLDGELATFPQFVTNHRTNKKEVVVQDNLNNLYLISTEGKVLWKKQLEGKIQGKILQVDLYKNRRLQLAFTTNDQFVILDRNGKEVPPFTKRFKGGNLNPLAIFNYDNKKEYRFVVTQGDKVFMYNNKGAIVKGFKYTRAKSAIQGTPKHFRIAKKDYLAFQLEDGTLKILNRVGDVRTTVNGKIDFSANAVYLYKNKFVLTDKKGILRQIAPNGKINATNLNLNEDHGIDATNNTFVYMNDNVLSIRGRKVELDFGVYTQPKIFYIYDKIYVSVTDIQNQKVYLFDSQAKSISNFPVFGASFIDLTDMENDRKLELVTQDQKNSIIIYQLN